MKSIHSGLDWCARKDRQHAFDYALDDQRHTVIDGEALSGEQVGANEVFDGNCQIWNVDDWTFEDGAISTHLPAHFGGF